MIGSSSQRLFTRVLTGSALLVVALAPVACKKDPTAPPLVAAEDLVVPVTAQSFALVSADTFVIPGGGSALDPLFAGQTISVSFTTSGATPLATITTPDGTMSTEVSFGSCRFKVQQATIRGTANSGIVGQEFIVNPCSLVFNTAGKIVGTTTGTSVTLRFGPNSSNPLNRRVRVESDGRVIVTDKAGREVGVGTVKVTGRTGSGG